MNTEKAKEVYIESLYNGFSIEKARESRSKIGRHLELGTKDKKFKHNVLKALEAWLLAKDQILTNERGQGYIRPSERNFE